jgi:hypothetical protein
VSKKKSWTDEEKFEKSAGAAGAPGIGGLAGQGDAPGGKERETRSEVFTDEELGAMPSYTEEGLAALPKPWTRRGEMLPDDKGLIRSITDKNRSAARIFVTGEALEGYIGEAAVRLLIAVNDVYYENGAGCEPLFINTRNGAVRMARFDPKFVWRCFHPDILVGLVQDEIDRLGVDMDPLKMDYFDFYQNMAAAMKAAYGDAVAVAKKRSRIDDFYQGMYLSCLLLFGKPGYMGVPVAEHFAQRDAVDFIQYMEMLRLSDAETQELERLRKEYGSVQALTNPEMHFVVDIYERALK